MVNVFRQALALDERRSKFQYNPWSSISHPVDQAHPQSQYVNSVEGRAGITRIATKAQYPRRIDHKLDWPDRPSRSPVKRVKRKFDKPKATIQHPKSPSVGCEYCQHEGEGEQGGTDSREVWFAGCHSGMWVSFLIITIYRPLAVDVGGRVPGLPRKSNDWEGTNVSNPSLLWMVQQLQKADVGIIWRKSAFIHAESVHEYLKSTESPPTQVQPSESVLQASQPLQTETSPQTEEPQSEELAVEPDFTVPSPSSPKADKVLLALKKDAECPVRRDKLSGPSLWWLLECLPLRKHYLSATGERWKRWS